MDSSDGLDLSDQIDNEIPDYTKWETRHTIFGLNFNYVPALSQSYINHWEISLCMPIAVLFIILSSYTLFVVDYIFSLKWRSISFFIMTLFVILYVISYTSTILEGPGYLPFYYPHKGPQITENKREDYLSGLVTTNEQLEYVKKNIFVPDTHYFRTAKRIVIRPDHFCEWCACFIGKKNYKLFFLFNFWGCFYVFFFAFSAIGTFAAESKKSSPNLFILLINMVYLMIALFFFLFQILFVCLNLYSILTDTREFEDLKKVERGAHKPKLELFEDVFGAKNKFYLWLIPIGAYHGIDDCFLVEPQKHNRDEWLL